jgi:hypothetical protein
LDSLSYEPKAAQLAKQKEPNQRIPGLPPGSTFVQSDATKTKQPKLAPSFVSNQKTTQASESSLTTINQLMSNIKISSKITSEQIEANARSKQIRKLKKQLREIESIDEKMRANGEQRLEKEQLEKLKRREAIVNELSELGEDID